MGLKITLVCALAIMLTWSSALAIETHEIPTFSGLFNMMKAGMGYAQEVRADEPDIYDQIDTYITMFLKGAGVPQIIANTTNCTDSTRDLAKGLDASITNMINNGFSLDSYLQTTLAIGVAQPTIKKCFGPSFESYKKTADHLSEFRDAKQFFTKMGLKVLYSFFDWYQLYYGFNDAIAKKNMTMISYYSGQFTNALLSFDNKLNGTWSDNGMLAAEPMVQGFFSSIYDLIYNFLDGSMILTQQQIGLCTNNVTDFFHNYDYAIEQFKLHTDAGTQNGVYAIADNFGIFHSVNDVCINSFKTAVQKVQDYLVIKKAPIEIIFNVVWNYRKVFKHMTSAIECSFSMDAKCIGYNTGGLIYQIFAKHK